MNLIEEEFVRTKKENPKKNTTKIILIFMVIIVLLIIATLCAMVFLKEEKLTATLNDAQNADLLNMLIFEEDGTIYVPIRDFSQCLNYRSFNGDYINKSEDINKCYIESDQEVVTFELNSNKIYKTNPNATDYDYYYIDEPIKAINGKLYTTVDGIKKAFNVLFTYDKDKKAVTIKTMDYLIETYKSAILNYGFENISEEFEDKKAILNDLVVVINNNKYGIFNIATDQILLEAKYDDITYIPTTGDFFVKTNGKIGMVSDQGKTKISVSYNNIEVIDQDLNLYVVQKENKYGVIDINENILIPIECDEVGMDIKSFEKNDVKNKYILVDNLIPVRKDRLWGLYNLNGELVIDYKYDSFGCIPTTNKEAINLLVIPGYNVMIACKDKRYIIINSVGTELWNGNSFDEVYMKIENIYDEVIQKTVSQTKYYLVLKGKEYDAEEQLQKQGITSQKENNNQNSSEDEEKEESNEKTNKNQSDKNTNSENETNQNTNVENNEPANQVEQTQNSENNGNEEQNQNNQNNGNEEQNQNKQNNGNEEQSQNDQNNGDEEQSQNNQNNGNGEQN